MFDMTPAPLTLQEAMSLPRMRDEQDVRLMLKEANRVKQEWKLWLEDPDCKSDRKHFAEAIRNYNALRGVVQSLQWMLYFPGVEDPLW